MTASAAVHIPRVDPGYVQQRAAELVARGAERVEVLRAIPEWSGSAPFDIGGVKVHVRACVSTLAVLYEYDQLPEGDYLIVLTDRDDHDLGDTALMRARHRRVHVVDPWSAVPELFGAQSADRDLRRQGTWVPDALFAHRPKGGWPPAPAGVVTAPHAIGNLLAALLGQRLPAALDESSVLVRLDTLDGRVAWQAVPAELRQNLIRWASNGIGPAAGMALHAAQEGMLWTCSIGLAMDVLWPAPDGHGLGVIEDQVAARVHLQRTLGHKPTVEEARDYADVARAILLRRQVAGDREAGDFIEATEALLDDLGWPRGAERSDVLRAGLRARLRQLASRARTALDAGASPVAPEGELVDVLDHRLASSTDPEVRAAQMTVRLLRWLATPSGAARPAAQTLTAALHEQVTDGAWVDRALAAVWTGSSDPEVGETYRRLAERVRTVRTRRDKTGASLLAAATASNARLSDAVPVEEVRARVLAPFSAARERVLLVVLDGMSAAIATEIAESTTASGWTELLPPPAGDTPAGRLPVLAALPTVTEFSRTSLFAGALTGGSQDVEKTRWRDELGARVFHKGDLVTDAGARLPDDVVRELEGEAPLVGVVLNTIDDALSKVDPGGISWTDDTVQHLRPLLNAAYLADRIVILTSDHGHVIERGSTSRSVPNADSRWRPVETGPVGDGEVLIEGPRCLAPGGRAILAWDEGIRYGSRAAGYHGGASLAEITVPLVVLARSRNAEIAGWRAGPPQTPVWWNDPVVAKPEPAEGGRRARRSTVISGARVDVALPPTEQAQRAAKAAGKPDPEGQGVLGFEIPEAVVARTEDDVVAALLASPTYTAQRARAGRHALEEASLRALLDALIERGGRAHRDTLAAALGVPAATFVGTYAAARRLLNVDGYPVLGEDRDGATITLNERTLREQFRLGGSS